MADIYNLSSTDLIKINVEEYTDIIDQIVETGDTEAIRTLGLDMADALVDSYNTELNNKFNNGNQYIYTFIETI